MSQRDETPEPEETLPLVQEEEEETTEPTAAPAPPTYEVAVDEALNEAGVSSVAELTKETVAIALKYMKENYKDYWRRKLHKEWKSSLAAQAAQNPPPEPAARSLGETVRFSQPITKKRKKEEVEEEEEQEEIDEGGYDSDQPDQEHDPLNEIASKGDVKYVADVLQGEIELSCAAMNEKMKESHQTLCTMFLGVAVLCLALVMKPSM